MRRRAKPAKAKVEAKPPVSRKVENKGAQVRAPEKRLAEASKREAEALEQLQTRDRELAAAREQLTVALAQVRESLDRQTATSEVLKVISRSTFELQPVLETLIENAVKLTGAEGGLLAQFDGEVFRFHAQYGASPEYQEYWRRNVIRPGRGAPIARAALERRTVHIVDVLADPEFLQAEAQRLAGYRTVLAVPMVRQDDLLGLFFLWRTEVRAFGDKQIDLVATFADQAVIAIENVRLFKETKEALEQQTATSEILRTIAHAQTDPQPVFDTIVRSAARLRDAAIAGVFVADGQMVYHTGRTTPAFGRAAGGILRWRPRPRPREASALRQRSGSRAFVRLAARAHQVEFRGLFNGKLSRLGAFEDLVDILGAPPEQIEVVRAV